MFSRRCKKQRSISMVQKDKLYRVKQLASQWAVSTDTVKRHIKSGRLPAVDMGTGSRADYRVAPEDAEAFLKPAQGECRSLFER